MRVLPYNRVYCTYTRESNLMKYWSVFHMRMYDTINKKVTYAFSSVSSTPGQLSECCASERALPSCEWEFTILSTHSTSLSTSLLLPNMQNQSVISKIATHHYDAFSTILEIQCPWAIAYLLQWTGSKNASFRQSIAELLLAFQNATIPNSVSRARVE